MKEHQGYLLSEFLVGINLDYIGKVNEYGLDPFALALFKEIKNQYENTGEVNLSDLSFGVSKAAEIIETYQFLSYSAEICVKQIEKDAQEKSIGSVTERLRNGNISVSDAIRELELLKVYDDDMLIDVSEMNYKSLEDTLVESIETGLDQYDRHVNDWKLGELTVLFGRNGEGKTTLISQIIAHCISKKTKTFLYSGEMSNNKIQDWLYRQVVGGDKKFYRVFDTKYGPRHELKKNVIEALKEWHKGTLYLYNRDARKKVKNEIDRLFSTMDIAVKKGVKLFVIDNLMAILEENADSLFSDQANLVQRCKNYAVNNNVHIVLMAHPNKEKKEITGDGGNLEKTDISGSNNIPNKADNIISVERVWSQDHDTDAIVTSLKDRESGQRLAIKYLFSKDTLRFYNDVTKQTVRYGWEKYLKPEEKTVEFYNGKEQIFKNGEFDGPDWL